MKYFVVHSLLLSLAFTSCGILDGNEEPAIPGKIVFSAKADGDTYQLFVMNADGSDLRQLTDGEFFATSPAWSPGGQRIAFASNRQAPAGSTTLWVIEANGDTPEPLVRHPQTGRPMFGNHPTWSPDGSKVAFDYCVDCELFGRNHEIFIGDVQTGTIDTLVQHPAGDGGPVWSPAGTHLLFQSGRACDGEPLCSDIYIISAAGKNLERITFSSTSSKSAGGVNWISPDSISYILYNRNTQLRELVMLDLETGEQRPILSDLQVNQFWTFWDSKDERFLSIEKNHMETPVTLSLFDLDGKTIEQIQLTNPVLKSAIGFKWKINR